MPQDRDRNQQVIEEEDDDVETAEGIGLKAAKYSLGDLVNRANYTNERIPLTRNGKPIAALIGLKDLERLRALDAA